MLQRSYIILIAGGAMLVAGIIITIVWAGSFAGTFLRESTIIGQTLVKPSESVNASLQVNNIVRPLSIAVHFKPGSNNWNIIITIIKCYYSRRNSKRSNWQSSKQKHIPKGVFYYLQARDYRKIHPYYY